MAATSPSDFYADHAWLLGEAANEPCPTDSARRLRETRIAAAVFKRRWRLLIGWRTQTRLKEQTCPRPGPKIIKIAPQQTSAIVVKGETLFSSDLPHNIPIMREELAILRSFLAQEIHTILFGNG